MRRAAFYLVASVCLAQLILVMTIVTGCFISKRECTGDRVSEIMTLVVTQSFALYAAEK